MRHVVSIIAAVLLCATGCTGEASQKQEDTNLARQVFVAESNPVEITVLKKQNFRKQIISNGKLEAHRKAALAFLTPGRLEVIRVADGSQVAQGDVLATLDTKETRLQLEQARIAYQKAELDLSDRLLDFDYGPQTDTASIPRKTMQIIYLRSGYTTAKHSLEAAQLTYERSTLTAPFAGKIADVKQKAYEQANGTFCTLIDDAVFNVKFAVLETEIGFISLGQPVQVYSFNEPENIVRGHITSINPTVDVNGQIQITAQIANNRRMIDGMNVRILAENIVPGQLVLPKSAVVIRDNHEVLFRCVDNKSVWTYVHITAANSSEYVVAPNVERGGELNLGDTVIISGNLNLGGDTRVEIRDKQ